MYTHTYNIHICVYIYTYMYGNVCLYMHGCFYVHLYPNWHTAAAVTAATDHTLSQATLTAQDLWASSLLPVLFGKQIKKSFPTCGRIWASPLGCLPLLDIQDPRISPMNMARELSHAASVFKEKRQTLGVWSTSQKYKTQRRGHIVSHDSVAEPLSPWVVCFNYCLQSVVSLCCLEGRVGVSVNLSLFPSTFLWLLPWVQNAYSLTWLQFFIFFFISSHFFLSLLVCNGSYKYLWEVS